MNELEKKMWDATFAADLDANVTETDRRDIAEAAAKIAIEEIKAAHREGYLYRDRIKSARPINEYLKQKGYE